MSKRCDFLLFTQGELETYGVDYDGPIPCDEEQENVVIPVTEQPFSDARYEELALLINPLRESDCYGIDILLDVLQFCCQSI